MKINNVRFCGGTILDEETILTAAHCLRDDEDKPLTIARIEVRAGITDRTNGLG